MTRAFVKLDISDFEKCRTALELTFARGHYRSPVSIKVGLTILCFSGTAFLAGRGWDGRVQWNIVANVD